MDENKFDLDKMLCFKIYSSSKLIIRLYKPILDKLKLTYPQYVVMIALWENEEMFFKDLSSRVMMQTGTLTPILQKLEAMGNIRREKDKIDERNVHIILTYKGKSLEKEAEDVLSAINKKIGITKEQYAEFLSETNSLFDILKNVDNN
jgi:DNA-binding MarR family transcriptional regulator